MRIIDADELKSSIDSLVDSMSVCPNMDYCVGLRVMKEKAINEVLNAPTIDSIYGYKIDDLVLAAETLSKEWVHPRDLANYHDNLKLAFNIVREEQEKAIEKYVEDIGADI
jgi:hypothetical protein